MHVSTYLEAEHHLHVQPIFGHNGDVSGGMVGMPDIGIRRQIICRYATYAKGQHQQTKHTCMA